MYNSRNTDIWIRSYLESLLRKRAVFTQGAVRHLHFMIADHFEPYCGNAGVETAHRRVARWCDEYSRLGSAVSDSVGETPKHTFFYPEEEYDPVVLDQLATLCREGAGDVEIHLHHDNDTSSGLRDKLVRFKNILHKSHGLLRRSSETGEILFGFVHGNWALDNSRRDGRWCGVNDELRVLKEAGCYADFTLPSAPSDTQTKKINSIYYATDDPEKPKSHDTGVDVEAGRPPEGDLMIIQGPLTLNWRRRKWGIFPRIENGEVSHDATVRKDRIGMWAENAPSVAGNAENIFLKVHTHGCNDRNLRYLLGDRGLATLYSQLMEYCDRENISLHFTTAFGIYTKIKEIEGCDATLG